VATGHDNSVRGVRRVGVLIATVPAAGENVSLLLIVLANALADAIQGRLDPRVRG
jgi:hypothetical protein